MLLKPKHCFEAINLCENVNLMNEKLHTYYVPGTVPCSGNCTSGSTWARQYFYVHGAYLLLGVQTKQVKRLVCQTVLSAMKTTDAGKVKSVEEGGDILNDMIMEGFTNKGMIGGKLRKWNAMKEDQEGKPEGSKELLWLSPGGWGGVAGKEIRSGTQMEVSSSCVAF